MDYELHHSWFQPGSRSVSHFSLLFPVISVLALSNKVLIVSITNFICYCLVVLLNDASSS